MNELLLKYLNSVKVFEAPNDQGKTDPPEKPKIEVDSVDNRKDDPSDDPADDDKDDKDDEEDDDDKDDDDKKDDETEEQKTERLAAEKAEKEQRKAERQQRKWDKLAAEKTAAERKVIELEARLKEQPKEGLTEEEVERRAAEKAEKLAAEKETKRLADEFAKTADTLIKAANKVDKDFEKKINEVATDTGILMPKYMVEILAELDNKNGHELLAQLANDEDAYEEICVLSERRMTKRLEKMSEELKAKSKTKPNKERERLPDPIEPVDGTNNRGNNLPSKPTQNMDDFVKMRNTQTAEARKNGKNIW